MIADAVMVAIGAVMGAVARHKVAEAATVRGLGPWHIAGINVAGSGALGLVASAPTSVLPQRQKALLGVGFCGALTTFSTFSVDVVKLIDAGRLSTALAYVTVNNVGSISAAFVTMRLGRRLFPPPALSSKVASVSSGGVATGADNGAKIIKSRNTVQMRPPK